MKRSGKKEKRVDLHSWLATAPRRRLYKNGVAAARTPVWTGCCFPARSLSPVLAPEADEEEDFNSSLILFPSFFFFFFVVVFIRARTHPQKPKQFQNNNKNKTTPTFHDDDSMNRSRATFQFPPQTATKHAYRFVLLDAAFRSVSFSPPPPFFCVCVENSDSSSHNNTCAQLFAKSRCVGCVMTEAHLAVHYLKLHALFKLGAFFSRRTARFCLGRRPMADVS